jgi:hypothetical protein
MRIQSDNWQYRNWERHAKVIEYLHRNRATIKEMSTNIGEDIHAVSKCIWGIPGRQVVRIENKIAAFLGVPREKLFG